MHDMHEEPSIEFVEATKDFIRETNKITAMKPRGSFSRLKKGQ
jgi:hypothetical protein